MRQWFSKADRQAFSSLLALVLLLGSMPLTSGIVIVSVPNHPEFTINICAPNVTLSCASNSILARPFVNVPRFALFFQGLLTATRKGDVVKHGESPDTPPPKPLV